MTFFSKIFSENSEFSNVKMYLIRMRHVYRISLQLNIRCTSSFIKITWTNLG